MSYALTTLQTHLDDVYPSSGAIGYLCLLDDALGAFTYTIDTATDILTTAAAHGWVPGTRVRSSTTGTQPNTSSGSLSGSVDYFVRVLSSTTLSLHTTLAGAEAGTGAIDFSDSGTGTLSLTEQILTVDDPIAVLINHELTSHPDYSRIAVANIGASGGTTRAEKPLISWVESVSGGNPDKDVKHILFLTGSAIATPGDTTGTKDAFITLPTTTTITAGNNQPFAVRLYCENAA